MMTSHLWRLAKPIKSKLVTSCVLSLLLAVTTPALADYDPSGQVPPHDGTGTTTLGPRSECENSEGLPLTVLAPLKYVGKTISLHPTFVWFVPGSKSFAMEFSLFEYGADNQLKLVQKLELMSSPGIMKLSLKEDKPGLAVGHKYFWQVKILCQPSNKSPALVAQANIEVVQMPSALERALSRTTERSQRVELYTKEDLWYDALGEALGTAGDSRLGAVALNLLEALAKSEEPDQSANLSQVISHAQKALAP